MRFFSVRPSVISSVSALGTAITDGRDDVPHHGLAMTGVGLAVSGDHLLVDTLGRFYFDVIVTGE